MKFYRLLLFFLLFSACPPAFAGGCNAESKPGDRCWAKIADLRPTQTSLGRIDVEAKREKIQRMTKRKVAKYFKKNRAILVIGPGGKIYIVDRHHTLRAAYEEGYREAYAEVLANLSDLSEKDFWKEMENRHWIRRRTADGKMLSYAEMPKLLRDLPDDPYRSLAWAVRQSGAFQKTKIPFAEFEWADFFRTRITMDQMKNWEAAVQMAIQLATTGQTGRLPGHAPVSTSKRVLRRAECWARFQDLELPTPQM